MFMELMHGTAHLASNVPCINSWQAAYLFIPTHRWIAGLLHFGRNNPWQCCTVSMLLPRHSSPSKIFRVREYLLCCHASLLFLGLERPRSADHA